MRISDWSSDVCSSDLRVAHLHAYRGEQARHWADEETREIRRHLLDHEPRKLGRARVKHANPVRRAARRQQPSSAIALHLHRARTAVDHRPHPTMPRLPPRIHHHTFSSQPAIIGVASDLTLRLVYPPRPR